MVHHGLDRQRDEEFVHAAQQHALVVTTYSLLSRDGDVLASVPWAGVILDEAQNVKNPDTKQARAARRLPADWRVVMTGTPIENHVGDLWSLFQFLGPDLLPPREQFHREFVMPIRVGRDENALARLKRRTGPFILRRLKSDPDISILVLGAGTGREGPGPLVSLVAQQVQPAYPIPVTIVPGGLSDEEIEILG